MAVLGDFAHVVDGAGAELGEGVGEGWGELGIACGCAADTTGAAGLHCVPVRGRPRTRTFMMFLFWCSSEVDGQQLVFRSRRSEVGKLEVPQFSSDVGCRVVITGRIETKSEILGEEEPRLSVDVIGNLAVMGQ